MMFQKTLLLLLVAHVSSYTSPMSPVREWASETQAYQPDYAGHYGGKYEPGPWTGSFSRSLDNADGFQQGKSSRWTGSSPTVSYSPYVQPTWNAAASRNYGSSYNNNNNGYYPTSEYNYDNMYAAQGRSSNGYRFYDENSYNNRDTRYATPYSQSYRNQQANYAYSNPQYANENYRYARDNAYAANQAYGGYRNGGSNYNYDSRRSEQMNGKKVDRWTGSSPTTSSNGRYLYDYGGRYYNIDGAYDDAYYNNGAEMPYRQEQGASYNNGAFGYGRRAEDYRYNEQNNYRSQAYKTSSMDGRGPYNQWTTPPSNNYDNRNYDRNQGYSERNPGYYRNGGYDDREAYNHGYGRFGFDRSAYRANGQMNSFQNSIYSHSQSGRQGQSWKSPLSPDDMASRKSSDDWSSASR